MSNTTIDHDEIRKWAESKGGKPAAVDRTHQGEDVGIIRIMFPDNKQSEHQALVEITWDEFFEQFEDSGLALIYDEKSLFSKLIGRDTAEHREHGEHTSRHHPDGRHSDSKAKSGGESHSRAASAKSSGAKSHDSGKGQETKAQASKAQDAKAHNAKAHEPKSQASKGSKGREAESDDLKSREYKDAEGNVHHHTRTYEQQHGKG